MRLFEMNYSLYRIIPQAGRLEYFAARLPTTMLPALLDAGGRARGALGQHIDRATELQRRWTDRFS